ncbi:unnamed protein product [Closterium sp. Naga37s-1]|nr:unnamed protein product [Closterium sp. Naga37s-1]
MHVFAQLYVEFRVVAMARSFEGQVASAPSDRLLLKSLNCPICPCLKAAVEQAKARRRVRGESGLLAGESGVEEGDVAVEGGDVARWEEVAAQAKAMEKSSLLPSHADYVPSHADYVPKSPFFSSSHSCPSCLSLLPTLCTPCNGTMVGQVEVDVLTGAVEVQCADTHYDCARSLNPAVDIGQVHACARHVHACARHVHACARHVHAIVHPSTRTPLSFQQPVRPHTSCFLLQFLPS